MQLPVVAEVPVVVVLDHDPVADRRPVQQGAPSLRRERRSGRELVLGAHDDGRNVRELVDTETSLVDADRHELEAGGGERRRTPAVARVLDRDARRASRPQDRREHEERLRRAGEDALPVGGADHAARPSEERG